MSNPTTPVTSFGEQLDQLEDQLDDSLHALRRSLNAGRLDVRQYTDLRIGLLTRHLASLTALRIEHFGEGDPATGWISGTAGTS